MKNKKYIDENFDLKTLKKIGFIKSIKDYDEIEKRICKFFGLKNIYEYSWIEKKKKYINAENIFSKN
ncbi:MAG: hypothetical protein WC390_07165 [Sulfurimonas sp.]|jgi:hypothetical protein